MSPAITLGRPQSWLVLALCGLMVASCAEHQHRIAVSALISTTSGPTTSPVSDTSTTSLSTTSPSTTQVPPGSCLDCAQPTTAPTTAAPAAPPDPTPRPEDFTGTLTVEPSTVTAGQNLQVALSYRNITEHVIEPSTASHDTLAIVCTSDLTADGHTNQELVAATNVIFVTNSPVEPGGAGGEGPQPLPTTQADIGLMTCEGVILTSANYAWTDGSMRIVGRLTNVAPVSVTVVPAPPSTTTTAPTSPNSSTNTAHPIAITIRGS